MIGTILCALVLNAQQATRPQLPLTIEQKGADVVVSTKVNVNMSAYILATSSQKRFGDRYLSFTVVHNADWIVKAQQNIAVSWRLPNQKVMAPGQYVASGQVLYIKEAELLALFPQWSKLTEMRR